MRIVALVHVSVLAAALAACGSKAGSTAGSGGIAPGGSGGSGGSTGGSGGTGGSQAFDCGTGRVLELPSNTDPAVLHDTLDTKDNWQGSCTPSGSVGYDVVVHFRAPTAGSYKFSTAGSGFDTVLYALTDCKSGFSEKKCDDNGGQNGESQFVMQLDAAEDLFLIVDSVNIREAKPFVLTATKVQTTAPVIDPLNAFTNTVTSTDGVRLSLHSSSAPTNYVLHIYNGGKQEYTGGGLPLKASFDDPQFPFFTITPQNDGTFLIEGSWAIQATVGYLGMEVTNQDGLTSELVVSPAHRPDRVMHGAACDTRQALSVCMSPADACIARPPATSATCSTATAPTITSASATVNVATGHWAVVVNGIDPEADVKYVRVLPFDDMGNPLSVAMDINAYAAGTVVNGATTVWPLHQAGFGDNGSYRVVADFPARFDGPCFPPAYTRYQGCTISQTACLQQLYADMATCSTAALATVASLQVEAIDETSKISPATRVSFAPAATSAAGGICDPWGGVAQCSSADLVCWDSGATIDPETCQAAGPTSCPDEYSVVDLTSHVAGSVWTIAGNNAHSKSHGTGSCGGGNNNDVYSFTAGTAGTYVARTSNLGTNVDTLLFARRWCQLEGYELGCNDDDTNGDKVSMTLDAGETIYIFVDVSPNVQGAIPGSYTLTVSRQ